MKHYNSSANCINQREQRSPMEMDITQINLLLTHRPDPLVDPAETGLALDDLLKQGKINAIGVSNFKPWDIAPWQSHMKNRLVTNQIEISLAETLALINGDLAYLQQKK